MAGWGDNDEKVRGDGGMNAAALSGGRIERGRV